METEQVKLTRQSVSRLPILGGLDHLETGKMITQKGLSATSPYCWGTRSSGNNWAALYTGQSAVSPTRLGNRSSGNAETNEAANFFGRPLVGRLDRMETAPSMVQSSID